jgi:hypothetical protein
VEALDSVPFLSPWRLFRHRSEGQVTSFGSFRIAVFKKDSSYYVVNIKTKSLEGEGKRKK